MIENARLSLANAILAAASNASRDVEALKSEALKTMARSYPSLGTTRMTIDHKARWEYLMINLAYLAARTGEVDVLNDAGEQGWELIAIMTNNVAYLRRPKDDSAHVPEQLPSLRLRKTTPRAK
jgi:hypothetical protein